MIVSAESMHHWRDPVAVFGEFPRLLRPGRRAWVFDGRSDFAANDLRGFTIFGEREPPAIVRVLMRGVLRVHDFSPGDWLDHVPNLVQRSRFGAGRIEPFGLYRRVELVKQPES